MGVGTMQNEKDSCEHCGKYPCVCDKIPTDAVPDVMIVLLVKVLWWDDSDSIGTPWADSLTVITVLLSKLL